MKPRLAFAIWVGLAAGACGGGGHGSPDAGSGSADAAIDAHSIDAPIDAIPVDAMPTFGINAIFPAAASRLVDTSLTIDGFGITATPNAPAIHLANCDNAAVTYDLTPTSVAVDGRSLQTLLAADPNRVQGAYTVTVTNGDGQMASLTCAFHILATPPPTITNVIPNTAWQGADQTVTITGTGLLSTPSVRFVSVDNPATFFDADFVGFTDATQITSIVPSQSQVMPAGAYNVFVTNPDLLSAEWMAGATPGVFTVTATAPPRITNVSPARIVNGACTSTELTITGSSFAATATFWYLAPTGTACTGSTTDVNGNLLCPFTVDSINGAGDTATAHLPTCPALGPYPVVVINPDAQAGYWYSIEITPSSDGHLNTGPFETLQNGLVTPRWKHAIAYAFDFRSNTHLYVAGGQDAAGNVLGSVEASQIDLFGTPGPFQRLQQYGGPTTPRVDNDLNTPRIGSTLVRVGDDLFSIGGATARSDTATVVAGSTAVERAHLLGLAEQPAIAHPTSIGTTGLPVGAWYYRVSAVGPWGEGLASREVVASNLGGQLKVCWTPPTTAGATGYNIYRSLASDGRAGSEVALAYEVTGTCFTDDGTSTRTPAPGNVRGTVGSAGTLAAGDYSYRVSAVVPDGAGTFESNASYAATITITPADVTATNQTVTVAWDPIPGATSYRVFRLDPISNSYLLLQGAGAVTTTNFADTGLAFDPANTTPRTEIRPLPAGSLGKWSANVPQLGHAREGLDGVAIAMDPTTSGGLVARILVAGGRDGGSGSYVYSTSAESLGVYQNGTLDAAWSDETPVFTHPRAYYALLTTQDRNVTPFPPPPPVPPSQSPAFAPLAPNAVPGTEPVYVVAVMGDDAFSASSNSGRADFESCAVDMATGHLGCGTTWTVQTQVDPHQNYGADAVLYFSFLYPFYGVQSETVSPTYSLALINSAIGRFPLLDLTTVVNGQIFSNRQSASTAFVVQRAYYQMTRLLAYVYVVGGNTGTGPTGSLERHQQ